MPRRRSSNRKNSRKSSRKKTYRAATASGIPVAAVSCETCEYFLRTTANDHELATIFVLARKLVNRRQQRAAGSSDAFALGEYIRSLDESDNDNEPTVFRH